MTPRRLASIWAAQLSAGPKNDVLLRRFTAACKSRYALCKARKLDGHVIGCPARI